MRFEDNPKVKEARRLLIEAELETIAANNKECAEELCTCGHKRKFHGHSHSINYTGGVCKKCDCLNFLMKIQNIARCN